MQAAAYDCCSSTGGDEETTKQRQKGPFLHDCYFLALPYPLSKHTAWSATQEDHSSGHPPLRKRLEQAII